MQTLCDTLQRYLHDALGIRTTMTLWTNAVRMPIFLQDRYRFFLTEVLDLRCLLMVDAYEEEESPAAIRKHIEQVRLKWDDPVVYVRERITAYNRKRLIEHKVPFIIPGTQMYLPMLGIDLREHFRKLWQDVKALSPGAQVVLIHALLRDRQSLGPTSLSADLGYSIMAMSRALDELEAAGLAQTASKGRTRRLQLVAPPREVWELAQPLLRSPVLKRHAVQYGPGAQLPEPRAGLEALAHYSMLAEPGNPVVALGRQGWKVLQQTEGGLTTRMDDPEAAIIEVWSYAPVLFADHGWVDRLSLYLSLRESQDERIQAALEQMIKEVAWYEV